MLHKLTALLSEEKGQGMTEYGLVLGVIAVGAVATLFLIRDKITALFTTANTAMDGIPTP